MGFFLERAWFAARLAPWWICWETFQIAAVVAGALLLALRSREPVHGKAYVVGIVCAVPGALALGCGGSYAHWIAGGAGGAPPGLEFSGAGALLAFLAGYALICRRSNAALASAFDAIAPSIAGILFFSRLGCFIGGCDFGAPSRLPWAVRFPIGTAAFRAQLDRGQIGAGRLLSLPVHPTQLYEAAAGLLLLAVLVLARPSKTPGRDITFVLLGYATTRILVDCVRGDLLRGPLGLTLTQGMASSALALGLAALLESSRAEARSRNPPL